MNAFSQIPQKIIWKFEDPIDYVPPNVLQMKWLPQRDILGKELNFGLNNYIMSH